MGVHSLQIYIPLPQSQYNTDKIFADNNNCKYNLTNYFTHNILYMKS